MFVVVHNFPLSTMTQVLYLIGFVLHELRDEEKYIIHQVVFLQHFATTI